MCIGPAEALRHGRGARREDEGGTENENESKVRDKSGGKHGRSLMELACRHAEASRCLGSVRAGLR